ncbi:MAG TPA: heavy-metal-associated domain-containing protein [Caldisericia bacterium]|jgi:copper chaperone CopZ|nr:heavy-metal-associated domain-containing protein [Caldisericia bacterium]MCE5177369.1 heavy-metal-associated domain-containing protein [bacterium]NMD15059.1 heavy-metal-associated domain-containing protein [Caldisericales bacterium]OQB70666.1 MAG: Heavy-metal-associated domain protein [bacterium ADurb.Bin132]HNW31391.1 heavy-metal-associated domain-containing protein [Caldisericia bacterium]
MTVDIRSKSIMCSGCAQTITKALMGVIGVKSVSVDVPKKTVTVDFDERTTSELALRTVMIGAGYPPDA